VALFPTCLGDELYPDVAMSVCHVLERLGCTVSAPQLPLCCGQPAYNSGYPAEAKRAAERLIDAFSSTDFIVAPSGSCVGMIRHNYERLFESDSTLVARAKELLRRTYEFSQFLVNVLKVEKLEASFPYRVTYHASCHAERLLGIGAAPLTLLSSIPDLTLTPLPHVHDCCGFGGTFSIKLSGISTAVIDEKVDHIASTGVEYVTSTDLGCLMNISGRMERRGVSITSLHLATLVDRAFKHREASAP